MTEQPSTLAIVGGGPRGVYAMEALARRAGAAHLPERIDVYEPREHLGTGMAYSLDQPDWVGLNVPDHAVHAGRVHSGSGLVEAPLAGPFSAVPAPADAPDHYPPRAAAGRYLTAMAERAIAALAPTAVRHLRHWVRRIEPIGAHGGRGGLRVHSDAGVTCYDAVLLVTGHAETWPTLDLPVGVPRARVFPVGDLVTVAERLLPGTVQVWGAHLSAVDAVLALTEGLGGTFTGEADRLRYRPGPLAPRLLVTSRSGRPMLAKTDAAVLRRYCSEEAARPFLPEVSATAELPVLLERIAAAILTQARRTWQPGCAVIDPEQVRPVWDTLTGPAGDSVAALRRSLEQARGTAPPDETWALGQAWRQAYAALVERQRAVAERVAGGAAEAPLGWADYPRLVAGLDRLAFGPPPGSVAKLLALVEAGLLQLRRTSDLPAEPPDLVVDAVSAPPGLPRGDELWERLLADGLVRLSPTGRGIVTDAAGACLAADGSANGLAAVGRMTEDHVLGTDTLLRTLHPELELWADRLLTATHT